MMSIHRPAVMLSLLLLGSSVWGQQAPVQQAPGPQASELAAPGDAASGESATPDTPSTEPQNSVGNGRPSGAAGSSAITLQVLNADGTPASGAKVLPGDTGRLQLIFNGRLLTTIQTGGGMGGGMGMGMGMGGMAHRASRELSWRETDQEGQITLTGDRSKPMGGGFGRGSAGPPTVPRLFVQGDEYQFGFLPPGTERKTLQLRKAGRLAVLLPQPTSGTGTDFTVLAWWNNGFAVPRQPKDLGYKQPDLVGRGWKFDSYFAVFQTARLRPVDDPFGGPREDPFGGDPQADPFGGDTPRSGRASLAVPPGEVRLTLVPTSELESLDIDQEASGEDASERGGPGRDRDYARLVELALYGGPSRIVSVKAGELKAVRFAEECAHSIELQTRSSQQPLPQWEQSTGEDTPIFLVRQIDLPGSDSTEVKPGSRAHESLLVAHRSARSQLPPVRVGRQTSPGTYRFDLLCPGTYQARSGSRSQLQRAAPLPDYSSLGETVHVRKKAGSPTYEIDFQPAGEDWGETFVIHSERETRPNSRRPSDSSATDDKARGQGAPDDPFGPGISEGDPDDPFAGGSGDDPFGGPGRGSRRAAAAEPAEDPFGGPPPDDRDASRRQRRLQMLKIRIRRLQQQLEAASRLVDKLEADAGSPSK